MPRGSISSVDSGDVIVWDDGGYGHVGIIKTVTDNGNGTSTVVSVNENICTMQLTHT